MPSREEKIAQIRRLRKIAEIRQLRAGAEAPESAPQPQVTSPQPAQPQQASVAPQGLGASLATAASNIPGSALQFAQDITAPIHSPVQTAKGLGSMAAGVYERMGRGAKGLALGPEESQKLEPGANEASLDALFDFVKERYGGWENIKRTLTEDPVGALGDVAGLAMGGGGLAAKAAGTAGKIGKIAQTTGKVGRALDPAMAAGKVAGKVSKVTSTAVSEILGLTAGVSARPTKVSFRAGRKGGAQGQAMIDSIEGKIPMDEVVTVARTAVGVMHKRKMDAYREGLGRVFSERPEGATKPPRVVTERRQSAILGPDGKPTTVTTKHEIAQGEIDLSKIDGAVKQILDQGAFKGVDISKSTAAMRSNIKGVLAEWKKLDPSEYHTVEGMDAMRKSIGDLVDSAPFDTPERRLANQTYFTVRKTIEAQAPGYGRVLKGYSEARSHLQDLEKALSLGSKAATETALRKLQATMRNDVTSAYGKRAEYLQELKEAGAGNLEELLAGQSLNPWMPRSMGSRVAGLAGGAAGASGMLSSGMVPLLALGSPRIVGTAAYRAGQATRHPAKLAEYMMKHPGVGQAAFQAGRAGRVK